MRLKSILIIVSIMILFSGCKRNDNDLCVKYDKQMICPAPDSKVVKLLAAFKYSDKLNDKKTNVMFMHQTSLSKEEKLKVNAGFDGYLSVINVDRDGSRRSLFPNRYNPDGFIQTGESLNLFEGQKLASENVQSGLGYYLVIFTEKIVYFNLARKGENFNGFKDDKVFKSILKDIQLGRYGKHYLKVLPYFK